MGLLKWLFSIGIKEKRIENLRKTRNVLLETVKEMEKEAKTDIEKRYYKEMVKSIENTPVFFVPGKVLSARKTNQGTSAIMGGNVVKVFFEKQKGLVRQNYIVLPSKHLFEGSKLSKQGLLTLLHEYGHLQGNAGERIADALMLNIGLRLGLPKESVLRHFSGRHEILGQAYPLYIKKILESRKPKKQTPFVPKQRKIV